MDVLVTALAGVLGAIAAMLTALALMKGKSVDANSVLFTSMNGHMDTLSAENTDLRERVRTLEKRTNDQDQAITLARQETYNCERDKQQLEVRVVELERQICA